MLYSCTHVAPLGVKGLTHFQLADDSGSIIGDKQLLKVINHHLVLT